MPWQKCIGKCLKCRRSPPPAPFLDCCGLLSACPFSLLTQRWQETIVCLSEFSWKDRSLPQWRQVWDKAFAFSARLIPLSPESSGRKMGGQCRRTGEPDPCHNSTVESSLLICTNQMVWKRGKEIDLFFFNELKQNKTVVWVNGPGTKQVNAQILGPKR